MARPTKVNPTVIIVAVVLALLALFTLYLRQAETLQHTLKAKTAQLNLAGQTLSDTESKLQDSQQAELQLRSSMDALKAQHQEETQALTEKLGSARQAAMALEGKIEALQAQHAESTADAQQKAAQILEQTRTEHQAAITRLEQQTEDTLNRKEEEHRKASESLQRQFQAEIEQAHQNYAEVQNELKVATQQIQELQTIQPETKQQIDGPMDSREQDQDQPLAQEELGNLRRQDAAQTEPPSGKLATTEQALRQREEEIAGLQQEKIKAAELVATLRQEHATQINRLNTELEATWQALNESRQAQETLQGLQQQFAELGGQYTENGMRLTLAESDLQFPRGQTTLPSEDLESLDRLSEFLKQYLHLKIRVEGHTDNTGSEQHNLRLSEERAQEVKQALAKRGVDAKRIFIEGMGEATPIASNRTADGRRKNRRVEIYLIDEPTP